MKYIVQLNKVEGSYTLKYIFNCEECPFFSHYGKVSICTKYEDEKTGLYFIENDYTITFLNKETKTFFKIPTWCGLKDSKDNGFLEDLSLCKRVENVENFKQKSIISRYDKEEHLEVCSYCNEKSESVIRRNNDGLCKFCLDKSVNDKTILEVAKRNNFKLKRINKKETELFY